MHSFTVVDPTGEQTVLSAANALSQLIWMDALQFNGRVVSAPWRSDKSSEVVGRDGDSEKSKRALDKPARAPASDLVSGSKEPSDGQVAAEKMTNLVASPTRSSDLPPENQLQATQFTDTRVGQDSGKALLTNVDSSMAQQASAEGILVTHFVRDQIVDPEKIEALREMVSTNLRRICTDMMKGASKKPSGPDPSAAALVLGQNFLCVRQSHPFFSVR